MSRLTTVVGILVVNVTRLYSERQMSEKLSTGRVLLSGAVFELRGHCTVSQRGLPKNWSTECSSDAGHGLIQPGGVEVCKQPFQQSCPVRDSSDSADRAGPCIMLG